MKVTDKVFALYLLAELTFELYITKIIMNNSDHTYCTCNDVNVHTHVHT